MMPQKGPYLGTLQSPLIHRGIFLRPSWIPETMIKQNHIVSGF